MTVKAIIFDRDGVLTYFDVAVATAFFQPLLPFSLEELADKWGKWGRKVGFPRNMAEERLFFRGFWDAIAGEMNLSFTIREQLHQFNYTSTMRPFSDVRPILQTLHMHGLRIGVLSNFSLASLDTSLEAVGLADLIDVACAATVIGAAKPTLEAYRFASQALGVQPAECLFLDDEIGCVEGGRAVGMCAYLVDRRRTEHALTEGIMCNLTAIPEILQME